MRPLLLKGHNRPLTSVKYNADGDLLFTCGKDAVCSVWWSHSGVRLGTYDGHEGAVWDCSVDYNTENLLTASSDRTVKLWDVKTGEALQTWAHKAVMRNVDWARGGEIFVCSQDNTFSQTPAIFFYQQQSDSSLFGEDPIRKIEVADTTRMSKVLFSGTNDYVVTANSEGLLRTYDVETGKMLQEATVHKKQINDLQWSHDYTMLTTASSDMTACVINPKDLSVVRRFESNRPLNGCCISPVAPHVLLGGGQEAINVTMTRAAAGHFEVDFFSAVYGKHLDSIEGHFGPVNSLAVSPDGKSFASGSEDGYIRLHHFDQNYLDKYGRNKV